MNTKTVITNKNLNIKTSLKAGGIAVNHVEIGLKSQPVSSNVEPEMNRKNARNTKKTLNMKTSLKAGGLTLNHLEIGLKAN